MNEVAHYVARVRTALADLPPAARDELLEDLPEHLAEVAAEGEGPLADRLGPPAAYAAELRAAAGTPTGHRWRPTVDLRLRAAVDQVRARLRAVDSTSGPLIGYQKGSDFVRLLRPAWWVVRGYLVALTVAASRRYRLGLAVGIAVLILPGISNVLQVDQDTQRQRDLEIVSVVGDGTGT